MNKCFTSVVFFLLGFSQCLAESRALPYDTIVCFGDSNSDTGNTFRLTDSRIPPPPYYNGRYSNGPIWIERLNISNILNYAYGSATTDNNFATSYIIGTNLTIPGIRQQIQIYQNSTNFNRTNFFRTLYVIWAGLFDYFSASDLNASTIINRLSKEIENLIKIGAKNLLIINQPPFRAYPAIYNGEMVDFLDIWTSEHNGNLSQSIQSLGDKYPHVSLYLFNIHSLINDILMNSSIFGITNLTNCWSIVNFTITTLCTNPNNYLFIDEFHFTSRVHQLIADRAGNLLLTSNGLISCDSSFIYSLYMIIFIILLSKNFI